MIRLALITKDCPRYFFPQFISLLSESNEFHGILIPDNKENRLFEVTSFFKDGYLSVIEKSVRGESNNSHLKYICDRLYFDKKTLPSYIEKWEIEKMKNILKTYASIAMENINFREKTESPLSEMLKNPSFMRKD
jgi:hypothetical protein